MTEELIIRLVTAQPSAQIEIRTTTKFKTESQGYILYRDSAVDLRTIISSKGCLTCLQLGQLVTWTAGNFFQP